MVSAIASLLLARAAVAAAGQVGELLPVLLPRTVTSLDTAAVAEAQQRDDTATRAFSNVQITTFDGRCLSVDKLSGDFRENLTPIQVTTCGAADGQGWDVITAGKHNNAASSMLVVSTLTQACLNFDPRRAVGNQVLLFSCGGRADGGGDVTNSQLFPFNGTAGPLSLAPENAPGSCLTVNGNVLDVADCNVADAKQVFVFGSSAAAASAASASSAAVLSSAPVASATSSAFIGRSQSACSGRRRTVTVFVTTSKDRTAASASALGASIVLGAAVPSTLSFSSASTSIVASSTASVASFATASTPAATGTVSAIAVPTDAVPVSRGGNLSPSAAAEANPRDDTATRNLTDVTIRAPNGQCLFVDPTAGDFRENLIPVSLVDCAGTPNERWDIITAGAHNNVPGTALIVSTLTNGCISFDGRRATGDTVTLFSCGGRADGSGQTNADQLMPFIGAFSFAFAPSSENGNVCLLPGDGRLVSGACPTDGGQLFAVFP